MNKDLLLALEQLEKEKGIGKEALLETIETALITAYKKNFPYSSTARVAIDRETGDVHVYSQINIVEQYSQEPDEILIDDAKDIDPSYEVGDVIEEEVTPQEFGRIAAQTAKQVVMQRIREAERGIIYNEFYNRETEIITGMVQRQNRGNAYINLGRTEAVLIPSEQIPGETYSQNERIKTYIVEVKNTGKGPQVLVSRTHPGLVKRLFELEVPEIHDGIVEIKSIAREAGARSKLAVTAEDPNVDAVGACVGQRGIRVQTIVEELRGEKIDIVNWSSDPKVFISNALSPSDVVSVYIIDKDKSAMVVVPDHQLSLAIGKEGQNARLAAKLTNWKIDIKSEAQFDELENRDEIIALDEKYYDAETNQLRKNSEKEVEKVEEIETEEIETEEVDETEVEQSVESDISAEEEVNAFEAEEDTP